MFYVHNILPHKMMLFSKQGCLIRYVFTLNIQIMKP